MPHLIVALQRAGEYGLGRRGGRFTLTELHQEAALGGDAWEPVYTRAGGQLQRLPPQCAELPAAPDSVSLRLETPMRIKHQGRFLGAARVTSAHMLRALVQRPLTPEELRSLAEAIAFAHPSQARGLGIAPYLRDFGRPVLEAMLTP